MDNVLLVKPDQLPLKCYYCSEIFPNEVLQEHLMTCQSIFEKCPENIEDYVARLEKEFHVENVRNETNMWKSKESCCEYCSKSFSEFESEFKILQLRIDDEKRNRLQFEYTWLTELARFHERYQKSEEWKTNMFSVLSTLQKSIFNVEQSRLKEMNDTNNKFDQMSLTLKELDNYLNDINSLLNDVKTHCVSRNEELLDQFDNFRLQQNNRIASLHNLNSEFEKLQVDHICRSKSMLNLLDLNEVIIKNQEACSKQVKDYSKDIETFKELFNKENYTASSIWFEQLDHIKHFKKDFKETEDKLNEISMWQKFVKKKLVKLEKSLKSKSTELIMNDIQSSLIWYPRLDMPIYSNGHLLWCIFDFEEQLEESRLTNVVIHSPIFYTNEYGYKLQMRLHPNGIGQWKGRHMIVSLIILDTDWDVVLEWPVKMNAIVFMKDQNQNREQAKDLVKNFGNNKVHKDNESSKNLQMFIPHRLLKEHHYICNNTLMLEAIVKIVME